MTKEERMRRIEEENKKAKNGRRRAEEATTGVKVVAKSSRKTTGEPTDDDFAVAAKTLTSAEWAGGNADKIIKERAEAIAKARCATSTPEKDPKASKDELIKKLNSLGRKGLTATMQANIATALGMKTYTADYDGFLADVTTWLRDPEAVGADSIETALAVLSK